MTRSSRLEDGSGRPVAAARMLALAACLLAAGLAWVIYHPERTRPFDILDFGEFLPILKRSSDVTTQFVSLVQYSAAQYGRANLVQYLAVVLKWKLFGSWVPGWQLTSGFFMAVLMVQTYQLLRQIGATRSGALVAASTYLFAPAAARGWVRLTMGEPMAMVVILWLSARALRFQQAARWQREIVLMCGCASFVLVTKELLAPVILLPVGLALTRRPEGSFSLPSASRRNITLVVAVGAVSLATLVPLAILFLRASPSALASQYGHSMQSLAGILAIWVSTLVPFTLVPFPVSVMWMFALAGFIALIAAGWRIGLQNPHSRQQARWLLGGSLLFPLLGALAYSPWPGYEERYGFPYLVGTSVVLGLAVSYLERESSAGRRIAVLAWVPIIIFGATGAMAHASRADAVQRAADSVVGTVFAQRGLDSVYVATAAAAVPDWTGLGPTLARLAAATDRPWPPTSDIRCRESRERLQSRSRIGVVSFTSHCGTTLKSVTHIVARYRRMEWSHWRIVGDSVRADIFLSPLSIDTTLLDGKP